jgi:hypothetical protein
MKNAQLLSFLIMILFASCQQKVVTTKEIGAADSFMPMQIGNSWRMGDHSYTEIQDTMRIDNKLYYKFYSLVGGDATDVKYMRIDENNDLLEAYPDQPKLIYTHAKFNAKVNDEFYTIGDKSQNDYKVKVVEKTDKKMTFEFDMVYHPNLKGSTHKVSYIKGSGLDENWKSIKIDGKVIK